MFDKIFNKFQENSDFEPKEKDVEILTILSKKGKLKQYPLEKEIKKIPHTTMTGRLTKLEQAGFIKSHKESDGYTYYEITPISLGMLFGRGIINFEQTIRYFENNQLETLETLIHLKPNLIQKLEKQTPCVSFQLTPSLWAIYYLYERTQMRKDIIKGALTEDFSDFNNRPGTGNIVFICANKIDTDKESVCAELRKECQFKGSNVRKCDLRREQMKTELANLSKNPKVL